MKIKAIEAREILDSCGDPTVETTVFLENGLLATASVPSGTSTGTHEALELRDNDENRFHGEGVLKAVDNINTQIAPKVTGLDPCQQEEIDKMMLDLDATDNKRNLGANAILAVSTAVLKSAALSQNIPSYLYLFNKYKLTNQLKIPSPIFVMFDGGKHGIGYLDFQEFHLIPASSKTYSESLQMGEEIYKTIGQYLKYQGIISSVGFEGGYTPNIHTNSNALEFVSKASLQSKYKEKIDFFLGLDVAASTFYQDNSYHIKDFPQPLSSLKMINFYQDLNEKYRFISLEDPLDEDDWEGWKALTQQLPEIIVVGDDLLCTNQKRVQEAINEKACNAILVKPNQIGTISETIEVIKLVRSHDWKIIVSHRSGETNDDFIADFSVGIGADYAKFGAPARGERVAKYNRLWKIEQEIKKLS